MGASQSRAHLNASIKEKKKIQEALTDLFRMNKRINYINIRVHIHTNDENNDDDEWTK